MCVQKVVLASQNPSIIFFDLFLFLRTYACVVYLFFSGKAASMSSRSPPTQFYERRKKSQCDVDVGEGSSRNPPRAAKKIVHMDFPRGRMLIVMEIEEVEEDPIESSVDESTEDVSNASI
jgi:hypothetical protein